MSSNQAAIERRQFYRVSDRALVDIKALENIDAAPETQFDLTPTFSVLREFHQLDIESKHLLRQITDKDKSLGLYLKSLNSKLDTLARGVALNNRSIDESRLREINISEGGVSVAVDDPFPDGTPVAIQFVLLPSFTSLVLKGKIISTDKNANSYTAHIKFYDLDSFNQQLIARHIIRKQGRDRKVIGIR
ncbi:PilZ domain-containing protein [Alkalimarinus sediminis]|uniref:PilZ domain-containing protein n=1 Tax=Alkalimarinus sediminis TaxID=1632866 RepID=A0A9E8HP23_9ALTE|nr:PilZ domain-containing protein [Alkalimarinus sediminis]UZW76128.1 PilZ domain-containing protein [Alkalimarinus sediminis]